MRILIIVVSDTLEDTRYMHNLRALPDCLVADLQPDEVVDIVACTTQSEPIPEELHWACGSSTIGCSGRQFDKMCHVLSVWEHRYDWYIKTRPDMRMKSPINLKSLPPHKLCARARVYFGPLK